jgi:hypothetical protein
VETGEILGIRGVAGTQENAKNKEICGGMFSFKQGFVILEGFVEGRNLNICIWAYLCLPLPTYIS